MLHTYTIVTQHIYIRRIAKAALREMQTSFATLTCNALNAAGANGTAANARIRNEDKTAAKQ